MRHFPVRTFFVTYGLLFAAGLVSCHKEEKLTADKTETLYTLPQGNHPYDDSIVAFHAQYHSYFLYKFNYIDYAYDYTNYLSITAVPANEAYVQQTISFFKNECLHFYPDSFIQKTIPFKIILASYIDTTAYIFSGGANDTITRRSKTGFMSNRSMLAIGWTDSTLQQQLATNKKVLRGYLHRAYFARALESNALSIPDEFIKLAPANPYYAYSGYRPQDGLIEIANNNDYTGTASAPWDFLCYIYAITSRSKAQWDATLLSPSVDTKGMIRKKYNALINYYKTQYGLDLQAIGDQP